VRGRAVDIAVEAAGKLLADKVEAGAGAALFKSALGEVKAKLN
jgi:F-type H+-transporting ATPase subunit b